MALPTMTAEQFEATAVRIEIMERDLRLFSLQNNVAPPFYGEPSVNRAKNLHQIEVVWGSRKYLGAFTPLNFIISSRCFALKKAWSNRFQHIAALHHGKPHTGDW